MTYFTYPAPGLGFLPDPDSVQDYDNLPDAIAGFFDDIRVTAHHGDLDMPTDVPNVEDISEAVESGAGYVFAFGGWLHAIGKD